MKEKIKELKLNVTFSAVLSIIIGILLLIYPEASISAIGRIVAIIVIIAGIAIIVSQVIEFGMNIMGSLVGGVITVIGIWMFVSPQAILSIIPIAIGVLLVVHGLQDLALAIEGIKAKAERGWIPIIIAVVNILLGFVCIANAFGFINLAFRIIGIMLIFDGLTDFGIVHQVRKASKDVIDSSIISEEDI